MSTTDDTGEKPPPPDPFGWSGVDDLDDDRALPGDLEPAPPGIEGKAARACVPAVTDAQLSTWIEAIVEQDERALAALYDATVSRVLGLVQRIVRNPATAEEVVEDAYFQVWRRAVRYDPARGRPMTWLLAMARSRAIDALRREARFLNDAVDDGEPPDVAGATAAADELLDLARHRSDLHAALMRLGAQPRQLVSLAFFRGLSHEEIAQHTHLPLGTVKSQIRRALLLLREILGPGAAFTLSS